MGDYSQLRDRRWGRRGGDVQNLGRDRRQPQEDEPEATSRCNRRLEHECSLSPKVSGVPSNLHQLFHSFSMYPSRFCFHSLNPASVVWPGTVLRMVPGFQLRAIVRSSATLAVIAVMSTYPARPYSAGTYCPSRTLA